jgi:Putative prokaryotic signal transducing protein
MQIPIAHAANEPEAEMIVVRLRGAGIDAVVHGPDLPGFGAAGGHEVHVDEDDADRARELLAEPEISDEELTRLSDEAGEEYGVGES